MHSLPFISHHLFVAAIGSQSRPQERPIRHVQLFEKPPAPASPAALEAMDDRKLILVCQAPPLRTSLARARG